MKKVVLLLVAVCMMVVLFAGCTEKVDTPSTDQPAAPAEPDAVVDAGESYTFGYTCMTMNNPFFIILEKSIRDKVEENGDKLITMDPAMDVAKQINQIEDMITQGIDAIFLNPVDWEGIRPALVALEKA